MPSLAKYSYKNLKEIGSVPMPPREKRCERGLKSVFTQVSSKY